MKALALALLFGITLTYGASAQLLLGVSASTSGGGAAVGGCSNKLDFSVACNSQYINVVMGF